jgi:hypothetical protein
MLKLTDYVEMAAAEYLHETGKSELDSIWIAEFFQDYGVQDNYPREDLVAFYALVQKELTMTIERTEKRARLEREKSRRPIKS